VVVPIHNEAAILQRALPMLLAEMAEVDATVDIALVENGSTDATLSMARSHAAAHSALAVLSLSEPDYGAAMRAGFLAAEGDWVVNFDIDYFAGSFVTAALATDADVVVASKRVAGANDTRGVLRRVATWGFNLLIRTLFRVTVTDTHGMKALKRAVVADIGPNVISTKDLFDTELVIRAEKAGYRIAEIPAKVVETREARSGLWTRVPRTVIGLFRLRIAMWRRG
ncbi:MAG: glycosyltransferase family 2 protein, partial [Acidimicrobiia bacterium]|nr:glycosyltransferase family 2 protein [Acidimicrobiia bacterium]